MNQFFRHLKLTVWGLTILFHATNRGAIRSIDTETEAKRFASLLSEKLRIGGLIRFCEFRSSICMEKSGK
jgi:hypothetical protein